MLAITNLNFFLIIFAFSFRTGSSAPDSSFLRRFKRSRRFIFFTRFHVLLMNVTGPIFLNGVIRDAVSDAGEENKKISSRNF